MLVGAGNLPSTSQVGSGGFTGYWDAYNNECGDTITVTGSHRDYIPWDNLKTVVPIIEGHVGLYRSRIDWRLDNSVQHAHYDDDDDEIVFGGAWDRKWAAAHEFGHALHEEKMGGIWQAESDCYDSEVRDLDAPTGYKCAFQEGFADYVGNVGAPDDIDLDLYDWETFHKSAPSGRDESEIEGNVAALFHDLLDDTTESGDEVDFPPSYVTTVFRTCDVYRARRWLDRDDSSDYVWCLEERVNGSVHDDNFSGVPRPSNQRHSASRPSGWNADDIRTTWRNNIGT
jgi:hypothetical protein